jgi:hypothetical protein
MVLVKIGEFDVEKNGSLIKKQTWDILRETELHVALRLSAALIGVNQTGFYDLIRIAQEHCANHDENYACEHEDGHCVPHGEHRCPCRQNLLGERVPKGVLLLNDLGDLRFHKI